MSQTVLFKNNLKIKASVTYLIVSIILLSLKFYAYTLTQSHAIFSDAAESIVNVVAALISLLVMWISVQPADRNHPYGHGKVEFLSSALEGGLLLFASISILIESIHLLKTGAELRDLNSGLILIFGTGIANAGLGLYLKSLGQKMDSDALIASGTHVLSDFWTSFGVLAGLFIVKWTGITLIDPLIAFAISLYLGWTGFKVVRNSASGLLDEEDTEIIEFLSTLFSKNLFPGIIRIHFLRVMRSGSHHHIDAHVVVPEFWNVTEAHEKTDNFEEQVLRDYGRTGEIHFHIDPCRKAYCRVCEYPECPIRIKPFEKRIPLTIEELVSPTEAEEYT